MQAKVDVQIKKIISNFIISYTIPAGEEVNYQIQNRNNIVVFSKSIIMLNAAEKIIEEIDVSHLPEGIYTLKIFTNTKAVKELSFTI